jgi:hypothetical protein
MTHPNGSHLGLDSPPPLEALLNMLERKGVSTEAAVLEEIRRFRAKAVKAR